MVRHTVVASNRSVLNVTIHLKRTNHHLFLLQQLVVLPPAARGRARV